MTWLAILLKPILWPFMEFAGRLTARWGAIVVHKVLPPGKVRRALFDPEFLDRHQWIYVVLLVIWLVVTINAGRTH